MKQSTITGLAAAAGIPVVNALSDLHHPCQALADFLTLIEHGFDFAHDRLAWVGDIMLADGPGRVISQGRDPFEHVAAALKNADLRVANLFNYAKPIFSATALRPPDGNLANPARVAVPYMLNYLVPRSYTLSATLKF